MTRIEARVTAVRAARPPLRHLIVELHARAPVDAGAWVLVPASLTAAPRGGVYAITAADAGAATVARLLGTGGAYAVHLAPGAEVTLSGLSVDWWAQPDEATPPALSVRCGTAATVGGSALDGWLGEPVRANPGGAVDLSTATPRRTRHSEGHAEAPLVLADETVVSVPLTLPAP